MKVRLTTFARPDQDLLEKFSKRYLFGTKIWKDLEFVTDESYDRLVIFTYPYKGIHPMNYIFVFGLFFCSSADRVPSGLCGLWT